jgi:predicted nucleotidyltransferase
MSHRENITRIKAVYHALEELGPEVVFVGGATVFLYSTRPNVETRPTEDVDIVVEITHYSQYAAIEEKLRSKGFANDVTSGVICRYTIHGIIVDVMPTGENVLGFKNRWYEEAFKHAVVVALDNDLSIRIFSAPYFLAAKLDAFADRGENDGRLSSDFEDIVHMLNHRQSVWEEINTIGGPVGGYLKEEFAKLLDQKYIDEWISVHLDNHEQRRVSIILGGMAMLAEK